jgi:hypothetical protein
MHLHNKTTSLCSSIMKWHNNITNLNNKALLNNNIVRYSNNIARHHMVVVVAGNRNYTINESSL